MIQHIQESCGLPSIKDNPTILFEDNAACIAQIKGDRTKHIFQQFFYTNELQKSGEIDVQQRLSSGNIVDLFTKSLPTLRFKKLIYKIGMRQLKDIDDECKTHLRFDFISHAILSILYPYSCKTHNISSKLGFLGFLMEGK